MWLRRKIYLTWVVLSRTFLTFDRFNMKWCLWLADPQGIIAAKLDSMLLRLTGEKSTGEVTRPCADPVLTRLHEKRDTNPPGYCGTGDWETRAGE